MTWKLSVAMVHRENIPTKHFPVNVWWLNSLNVPLRKSMIKWCCVCLCGILKVRRNYVSHLSFPLLQLPCRLSQLLRRLVLVAACRLFSANIMDGKNNQTSSIFSLKLCFCLQNLFANKRGMTLKIFLHAPLSGNLFSVYFSQRLLTSAAGAAACCFPLPIFKCNLYFQRLTFATFTKSSNFLLAFTF